MRVTYANINAATAHKQRREGAVGVSPCATCGLIQRDVTGESVSGGYVMLEKKKETIKYHTDRKESCFVNERLDIISLPWRSAAICR